MDIQVSLDGTLKENAHAEAHCRSGASKSPVGTPTNLSDLHKAQIGDKNSFKASGNIVKRVYLRSKRSVSSKRSSSSVSSSALAPSDDTSAPSQETLAIPSTLPESLQSREAELAAGHQTSESEQHQSAATLVIKAKWLKQRKAFITHIDEIHASNERIKNLVMMRALNDIHKAQIFSTYQGKIPDDVLHAQNSLQRLHRALAGSNKPAPSEKALEISLRIQKASDYVQLQKKLVSQYDCIDLREESAVYTLQVHSADAVRSRMLLAETMMTVTGSSVPSIKSDTDVVLSHFLRDQEPDADEPFKNIGSISTPGSIADNHQLFQDISSYWEIQSTVAELIKKNAKYRTYVNLGVQIALSYMYFASIDTSHTYPHLSDYRYYKSIQEVEKALRPDGILMPYLRIGFGSKAPKKSTIDVGGPTSYTFLQNEGITKLGILLHQVGCWTTIDEQDLSTAREVARAKRNELMHDAGMPYTQVVDLCFASKDIYNEPQAQAEMIYRGVLVPLQRIVDDLRWD